MIHSVVWNLRNGSKSHLAYANPISFADSSISTKRFFSISQSKYGLMTRPDLLQSTPLAIGLPSKDFSDPYNYTQGRWLRCDKLQHDSRRIEFSFDALCGRVIELCPDAVSITSYEKKEGGFNRAFIFTMNDGKRVVARLPTRITGPPTLTTNSEVATIKYLKSEAKIPIPTILNWSDDPSNTIGSEYIIMEHVKGVPLYDKWATMSGNQQLEFIIGILEIVKRRWQQWNFRRMLPEVQDYVIGPHCGPRYWDCNPGEERYYSSVKPNRGPWPDLAAYCSGLIDTGFSRLPPIDAIANKRPSYHGSVAEHISLLGSGLEAIFKLIEEHHVQAAAAPTLLHPDLSSRNIYVSNDDPTTITGIIDWQSSSIEPAFIYADDVPDFAVRVDYNSSENHISPEENLAREDATAKAERCNRLFDLTVKFRIPKLSAARTLDGDLRRIFDYCSRTWIDGAAALRQILIEISSRWKELRLADSCLYPIPSPDALLVHQKDFQGFQTAQEFRQEVMRRLDIPSDGWVPADSWNEKREPHKHLFNEVLRTDQTMTEQELREVWLFDSP